MEQLEWPMHTRQPTRRTRHVEMKHFVILQWTDDEFINFVETRSNENYSDSLSKPTGRTKFYEHTDVFMGRVPPSYTSHSLPDTDDAMSNNQPGTRAAPVSKQYVVTE